MQNREHVIDYCFIGNLIERKEFTSRIPAVSPNIQPGVMDSQLKTTSQQDELAGVFRARKKELHSRMWGTDTFR